MIPIPQRLIEMRRQGWCFTFDEATRFVGAVHTRGGKQSIIEIRNAEHFDLGYAIAEALNAVR